MLMQFKLLQGRHADSNRSYKPGDVVESNRDLGRRFGEDKFRRLHENEVTAARIQQQEKQVSDLTKKSVKELQQMAADLELEVSAAKNSKEELIKLLQPYV